MQVTALNVLYHQRGKCVVLLDCFWAFGACAEVLLAAVIMPTAGWRWLLALSALPSLAFSIGAAYWLPESARFNAARGQGGNSKDILDFGHTFGTILGRFFLACTVVGGYSDTLGDWQKCHYN